MPKRIKRTGIMSRRWLLDRLYGRPDSEHEMSFNRIIFAVIIVIALLTKYKAGAAHTALIGMAIYIILALAVLGHILLRPGTSWARRIFALFLDCGFLSWQLHLGGGAVAVFFPIYLWVIFGNGFRFGLTFLAIAVPVATLSFGLVVATTPYWYEQQPLSVGLLIGLVILPAYAGTLIRKLSLATQMAEEANNAKSIFLASVSHELRTPLTAIVGMSGLLRISPLDATQREMLETIEVATGSLKSLINGLLDLSRIEAGRMPTSVEEFDLLTLLLDVRRMVESQLRAKGLRFDIHVTPRTPLRLLGSRVHLHAILVNLAGNAVKFTEIGGIVIAVDGQPVEGTETGLTLQVEVSDTGIGIAPQNQTRIFENFTQGDATILNRFGGTGLGLAITRQLVGLLGGSIDVDSTLGEGSTFRFDIKADAITVNSLDSWPVDRPAVTLFAHSPQVIAQLQERLESLSVAVTITDPRRSADELQAHDGGTSILFVYERDWEDSVLQAAYRLLRPVMVLIDEAAGPSLPDLATRKRCVSVLSDLTSNQMLHQALSYAIRLRGPSATNEAAIAPQKAAQPSLQAPALPLPTAPRRRVLLVDDNRVNQRVFARILESAGHKVLLAENGERALDILEREADRLDIVLMDFNMPELDGLEATKLYRFMSTGDTRLPIIGLTADALAQTDRRWRDAGMDGCLVKPVEPKALLAAIDSMSRAIPALPAMSADPVATLHAYPRLHLTTPPAIDETIFGNLLQLGDNQFINELLLDFLEDAKDLIGLLTAAARQGDATAFRSHAHALQSSSVNVGAVALGALCTPWVKLRGRELQTQTMDFADRAQSELARTQETVMALAVPRRTSNF